MNFWLPEHIERLTFLWENTSISALGIGKELNVSKNAVIGKAHRLELKSRKASSKPPSPLYPRAEIVFPPPNCCRWADNHVGDPDFHFCGKLVAHSGDPWCAEHAARVFEKYRPMRDAAD